MRAARRAVLLGIAPDQRPHGDARAAQRAQVGEDAELGAYDDRSEITLAHPFNSLCPHYHCHPRNRCARRMGLTAPATAAADRSGRPTLRAPPQRRIVERFTVVGPDTLNYSVHVDDPEVWTAPWTSAFPWRRDNEYRQYEYACHEENYAVQNSLNGARVQERATDRAR